MVIAHKKYDQKSDEEKSRALFSSRMHFGVADLENLFKAQQVSYLSLLLNAQSCSCC